MLGTEWHSTWWWGGVNSTLDNWTHLAAAHTFRAQRLLMADDDLSVLWSAPDCGDINPELGLVPRLHCAQGHVLITDQVVGLLVDDVVKLSWTVWAINDLPSEVYDWCKLQPAQGLTQVLPCECEGVMRIGLGFNSSEPATLDQWVGLPLQSWLKHLNNYSFVHVLQRMNPADLRHLLNFPPEPQSCRDLPSTLFYGHTQT